jgi:hypothetical protein
MCTVCTAHGEAPALLPQRRPAAELADPAGIPRAPEGAPPPRRPPDVEVLRQVLAGLRRLD